MPFTFKIVALLAVALAGSVQATAMNCKRINGCVSSHQPGEATAYCSSYLSIGTYTSTITPPTSTSTTTVTSYTSTTTVIDDSVYQSCGSGGNSKVKRADAAKTTTHTHSIPFCLRHFTQSTAISSACSCLHIVSATTTITAATATTTTTATVSAVSTSSTTAFFMQDETNGYTAVDISTGGQGIIDFYDASAFSYSLNGTCVLEDSSGSQCFVPGGGTTAQCFNNPASVPSGSAPIVCTIAKGTNVLSCAAGDANVNVAGGNGGDGYYTWELETEANPNSFTIIAYGSNPRQ